MLQSLLYAKNDTCPMWTSCQALFGSSEEGAGAGAAASSSGPSENRLASFLSSASTAEDGSSAGLDSAQGSVDEEGEDEEEDGGLW